ncbi:S8 family serine peptidase [Massilia sp. B-10]|nr:S8 family serine peptidase [Massilia sp. B-10]
MPATSRARPRPCTGRNSCRPAIRSSSAEGSGGHGTHTASTAHGNANVIVNNNGLVLGKVSGMAPRARVAAYKVCWTDGVSGKNGCATANSVAAVEQAVKDGVNVINFSIGPEHGMAVRSAKRPKWPSSARPAPACSLPLRPVTAARPRPTSPRPRTSAHG